MQRMFWPAWMGVLAMLLPASSSTPGEEFRRLPLAEYRDKMEAAWLGQMAGVGWGGPTEFHAQGRILREDEIPAWRPDMINQFHQDDIYVEMTFLRTLEQYGWDVSQRQAGIDFANSRYPLWHANRNGRDNLRSGIAPPDSGHPQFNRHADDIDYQIEADFSGIISPGMPNAVIALGEKFGRLMNYGDGLYGGQFVGGMYAEAFFESDPARLVEAGLRCIPAQSQYAECIRDVLAWWRASPDDWQAVWKKINDKYHLNPDYRRASCSKGDFNIDAKLNGAYIVMGLLYGRRDIDRTIIISTRCGQDSDCNPSNAAGILFATLGVSKVPERFTSALNRETVFSHTEYNFDRLIQVCERLAKDAVVRQGGRIERDADGNEVLLIPLAEPKPGPLEQCWEPGPIAGSRYTDEERAKILYPPGER
ncbi:MAG: ADP-ribosylglycohydrolase family protein [Thermogutta sp.]|nr:ADP-ribosylglycohydrolase family protein [Thermogutta sp.]